MGPCYTRGDVSVLGLPVEPGVSHPIPTILRYYSEFTGVPTGLVPPSTEKRSSVNPFLSDLLESTSFEIQYSESGIKSLDN